MNKVIIKDGKAILYDDRWVTIGGEDEDGSGQHVLIKENGTIVAGFGKGKNVKNAFSEKNKESGGGAKWKDYDEDEVQRKDYDEDEVQRKDYDEDEVQRKDYENQKREIEKLHKSGVIAENVYKKRLDELNRTPKGAPEPEEPKSARSASSESAFNKAKESVKNASFGTNPQAFADAESEAKEQLKKWKSIAQKDPTDALAKRKVAWAEGLVEGYKERRDKGQVPKDWAEIEAERKRERENALKEAKPFTKKYKFNSPEEEEANRKAKAEIFRQANEESKRKQAEKDRKDKIEARKALKRAEAGLAEAKAKGDGKSQSFWEATRNRAENTLGKSSDPERQIKLLERERDRKYDEAETEAEKTKVFNAYKRKIDAIRNPKSKAKEVPISTLRSQQAAIQQRVRGYNNQIAELEKNPTERNKARIQKLQAERDAMEKRGKDVDGRIRSHSDYEKPTSEKPKNVVKVEPNKVTITKSAEGYEGEKSDLLERISDLNWQIASKPGDRMTPYKRQLREDMRKRLREIMEAEKANK